MPVNAVQTAARERLQIVQGPSWRLWGRHLWCVCDFTVCVGRMQAGFPESADGPVQLAIFPCVHTCKDAHKQTHTHTQGLAWGRCFWNTRPTLQWRRQLMNKKQKNVSRANTKKSTWHNLTKTEVTQLHIDIFILPIWCLLSMIKMEWPAHSNTWLYNAM